MIIAIPGVLDAVDVDRCNALLRESGGEPGAPSSAAGKQATSLIMDAVARSHIFTAAALPGRILPPQFLFRRAGEAPSFQLDDTSFNVRESDGARVRRDLLAVLFLSEPTEYKGGEYIIADTYGCHTTKLAAGSLLLFSADSEARSERLDVGECRAALLAVESVVKDEEARALLFELDASVQMLDPENAAEAGEIDRLTSIYHSLMRRWSE